MGCAHGHLGAGESAFEHGLFAQGAPEDGVHEAACAPGEIHGFIYRRVCGGAHMEDLVEAEAQDFARLIVEDAVAQLRDEKIERGQISQNAEKRLHEKRAIERREAFFFEEGVKDFVGE